MTAEPSKEAIETAVKVFLAHDRISESLRRLKESEAARQQAKAEAAKLTQDMTSIIGEFGVLVGAQDGMLGIDVMRLALERLRMHLDMTAKGIPFIPDDQAKFERMQKLVAEHQHMGSTGAGGYWPVVPDSHELASPN